MIDQVGNPDYSLRELVAGLREVRDALFELSENNRNCLECGGIGHSSEVPGMKCPHCEGTGKELPTLDKKSETPRTDAALKLGVNGIPRASYQELMEFAYQLERELALVERRLATSEELRTE